MKTVDPNTANTDHTYLFQYSFFLLLVFFVVLAAGISAYAYRRKLSEGFQVGSYTSS